MIKKLKMSTLRPWVKWLQKAKGLVLWVPIISLAIGCIVSAALYLYIKQREIESQKIISYQRAKDAINQLDLQISNSLLRIQTYEDTLGTRNVNYSGEKSYIAQALEYTVFHRLTVLQDLNPRSLPTKNPTLKLLTRIDRVGSELPKSNNQFVKSEMIIKSSEDLKKSGSYHKTFLYENNGMPRISVLMRSKARKDIFFIFTAPLISIFDKIDLDGDESILVHESSQDQGWIIVNSEPRNEIKVASFAKESDLNNSLYHFNFAQGLPQSGLPISFQFNYAKVDYEFISAANISGFLSLFITLIISYLFYVLITLNQTAQRMIISKTLDLEKTAHDLQEALNGKTKFLGKISHEIRTPLNLILGMIDLCEENDKDKKLTNYLRSMKSSGEHLLSMIDDLLDLAKAESNDLNFHGRKTNFVQFLSDVSKLCSTDCESKGLKLYTSFAHNLPAVIVCDPNRLRQVFLNLLRNACKYTHHGHINFNVSLRGSIHGNIAPLRFEIQDTGVGIPKDKLNKVFDAFFQVESSSHFSEGGVGLGLSIVKDIVKKLNGKIEVQSTMHVGSSFQVDLDLEVQDSSPWIHAYKAENPKAKKLIVFTTDALLQKSFEPLTHHPQVELIFVQPKNFKSYLTPLHDKQNTFLIIDAQTTDFNLEDISRSWNVKNLVLIGKTATNLSSITNSLIAFYSTTPFLPNELLGHIGFSSRTKQRSMTKMTPATIEAEKTNTISQENLKLIVADDDIGNIELYKAYFAKTSWQVQYAINGLEAWDLYQKEKSDLMILDVRMPIMDGFSVIQKVRDDEEKTGHQAVPIIVVTADLLDYTTEKSKQFKDVTLLTKPLKKNLLFEQISKSF